MNLKRVFLIAIAVLLAVGTHAQRVNRTEICQDIPNLTPEQQQKIGKLSATHQLKMDGLREQFYAEPDAVLASGYKIQMNTEMRNNYNNISGILTADQQIWFDQTCNVNSRRGSSNSAVYGRGQGKGRGQGYGRGQVNGRGQGKGRGQSSLTF